jgi:predicted aconitase
VAGDKIPRRERRCNTEAPKVNREVGWEMEGPSNYKMQLTAEEQAILKGGQGEPLRKAMESVVSYGAIFGAQKLVAIDGAAHMVTSFGLKIIKPYFGMVEELIAAGLHTQKPFTVDPRPIDYENVKYRLLEKAISKLLYGKRQKLYEGQLAQLGLRDSKAFTCTCYLPEVGNIPRKGDIMAWSESSAVVYANSLLGARTNRNSAGIDLLCNVINKAPLFGLLTDEGRRATWLVEIRTSQMPNAQLLGSAIGLRVMEEVPYVVGLDRFLGEGLHETTRDYLKDMGAASASNGAVGLYHVENITPEAIEMKRDLLVDGYRKYVVDDAELEQVLRSYPIPWKRGSVRPQRCFIGCPHLSLEQLRCWARCIPEALQKLGRACVKVETYLCAAPDVIERLKQYGREYKRLIAAGVRLTSICPLAFMSNPLSARKAVITNSNKLRTYSTARFVPDEQVSDIITEGHI